MAQVVAVHRDAFIQDKPAHIEILVVVREGEDLEEREHAAVLSVLGEAAAEHEDEYHGEHAGEIDSEQFVTNGIVWDTLPVDYHYNGSGAPGGVDGLGELQRAHQQWNDVATSSFEFDYQGTTSRCPSLYDGCPGSQFFDGNNDVGWANVPGSGVLGVTWFGIGTDEFDMVIDNTFSWDSDGPPISGGQMSLETCTFTNSGTPRVWDTAASAPP